MKTPFPSDDDLFHRDLLPGVGLDLVWGERIMLSRVTIEPDGVVPLHRHEHEQAGVCLSGEFDLEVDGETRRIRPGQLYLIPGGTAHAARGVGVRCVTLDIFSPPRDDYKPGAEPTVRQE